MIIALSPRTSFLFRVALVTGFTKANVMKCQKLRLKKSTSVSHFGGGGGHGFNTVAFREPHEGGQNKIYLGHHGGGEASKNRRKKIRKHHTLPPHLGKL